MGDRAPASFTVYTCPDQCTANRIMGLAQEYSFGFDWEYEATIEKLALGKAFTDSECSLGNDGIIADELQKMGVIAVVTQDAKYEYDGQVHFTHPDLGIYTTSASQDGDVMVRAEYIHEAIEEEQHNDTQYLIARLEKLTGKAYQDAIEAAKVDITSERFPTEWTWDPDHECEACSA